MNFKSMWLALAALLLISSGAWAEETLYRGPVWHQVVPGETFQSIAEVSMTTVEDIIRINGGKFTQRLERLKKLGQPPKLYLIPYEWINVNPNSDANTISMIEWIFRGQDPNGESLVPYYLNGDEATVIRGGTAALDSTIGHLALSEAGKDRLRSMLKWTKPRIDSVYSTPDHPLLLADLFFGAKRRHPQVWHNVVCLWTDPRTGKPDQMAYFLRWPRVPLPEDSTSFEPWVFLDCQNLGQPVRIEESEPRAESTVVEPQEVPVAAAPESVVVEQKEPITTKPERRRHPWDFVMWFGPEGKWPEHSLAQINGYWGSEIAWWWDDYRLWGFRFRAEDGIFGIGRERSLSQNYSLGLCLGLPSTDAYRLEHDFGVGYRAEQTYFRQNYLNEDWDLRQKQEKLWVDGLWSYYRARFISRPLYADGRFRDGRTVREWGGYITATPGDRLYGKVSADRQTRKDWERHLHGETQFGPADTTDMFEARVGIRCESEPLLVYAVYHSREYYSPDFWQLVVGGGLGIEWFPISPDWCLQFESTYNNYKSTAHWWVNDRLTSFVFRDRVPEAKLIFTYSPQRWEKPFLAQPFQHP